MDKRYKWTIMIYFAGDNNLGEEMVWALKDIQRWRHSEAGQAQKENVKVVALFETGCPAVPIDFDNLVPKKSDTRKESRGAPLPKVNPNQALLTEQQNTLENTHLRKKDGVVQVPPVGD